MTSPIALYSDTLLGQVLVATTYPLDVLKADRFLTTNAAMADTERAAAVNDQDWPDAVKSLAAGFPELISRMAEHSDWTETMGAALIVQTDDVLLSIQRLRAQAQVNGYLEDNAAMTVETDPETANISIASTDPNVVYVPEYTDIVYYQPAPATPYYVYDNNSNNNEYWGDALVGGAVIWGTAVIIDNIFDDNWDNGWDNGYWHGGGYGGGGNSIDWNGDVNIDNGINIGNGNGNHGGIGNGNHGGIGNGGIGNGGIGNGDRPQIGNGGTILGGDKMAHIDRTKLDATGIGKGNGIGSGAQIGGLTPDQLDRARDANFKPTAADREAAREKLATREASGKGVATLPAAMGTGDRGKDYTPSATTKLGSKPAAGKPAASKPAKATASTRPAPNVSNPNVSKPKVPAKPPSKPKPSAKAPAYKPQGGSKASASSSRGKSSRGGR